MQPQKNFENFVIQEHPPISPSILTAALFYSIGEDTIDHHQNDLWLTLKPSGSPTIAALLSFSKTIAQATIVPRLCQYHVIDFRHTFYNILFQFYYHSSSTLCFARRIRLRIETEFDLWLLEMKVFAREQAEEFWKYSSLQKLSLFLGFEGAYRSFLRKKYTSTPSSTIIEKEEDEQKEKSQHVEKIITITPEDWPIWNNKNDQQHEQSAGGILRFLEEVEIQPTSPQHSMGLHSHFVDESLYNLADPEPCPERFGKLVHNILSSCGSLRVLRFVGMFIGSDMSKHFREPSGPQSPLLLDDDHFFRPFLSLSSCFPRLQHIDLRKNWVASGSVVSNKNNINVLSRFNQIFPNLKSLCFYSLPARDQLMSMIARSIQQQSHPQQGSFENTEMTTIDFEKSLPIGAFPRLEFLQIASNFRGKLNFDESTISSRQLFSSLRRLELGPCSFELEVSFSFSHLPASIQEISMGMTPSFTIVDDADLSGFSRLESLVRFEVFFCGLEFQKPNFCFTLGSLPASIEVFICSTSSGNAANNRSCSVSLKNMHHLTRLERVDIAGFQFGDRCEFPDDDGDDKSHPLKNASIVSISELDVKMKEKLIELRVKK